MMKRSRQRNFGGLPEWLKGADCKSVGYAYTGSNPVAPICSAIVSTRSQFDESRRQPNTGRNSDQHIEPKVVTRS